MVGFLSGLKQQFVSRVKAGFQDYAKNQVTANNTAGIPTHVLTKPSADANSYNHVNYASSDNSPQGGGITSMPSHFTGKQILGILLQHISQEANKPQENNSKSSNL